MMEPYIYQKLAIKNRIVRTATNDYCGNYDGSVSASQILLYERLAKTGIGLIITGNFYVTSDGRLDRTQNAINEKFDWNGARDLIGVVHRNESRIVFQLSHAGRKTKISVEDSKKYDFPKKLEEQKIHQINQAFVDAAKRAKDVGADGVQIHFGHGYLLSQILTEREDGLAITAKLLSDLRKQIGDYPVLVKVNTDINEEIKQQFWRICEENNIWAIELSGSDFISMGRADHLYYLEEINKCQDCCDVPIILTGGIRNREDMQMAFTQGAALVGMSRPFIRNPELMKDFLEQGSNCISCNQCFQIYQKTKRHCAFRREGEQYES